MRDLAALRQSTPPPRRCGVVTTLWDDHRLVPEPPADADDDTVSAWAAQARWDIATGHAFLPFEWERVRGRLRSQGLRGPDTPEYLVSMAKGVAPVWDVLATDPGLLEDEVWRLFVPEEAVLRSLNSVEQYPPDAQWWSTTLAVLANRGHIDRERLRLDAVTARDASPRPPKARFYVRLIRFLDEDRRTSL